MPKVKMQIIDEMTDEVIVENEGPLYMNENEIAAQAYCLQRLYNKHHESNNKDTEESSGF